MARTITVEVDSREKDRIPFPAHVIWCPQVFKPTVVKVLTVVRELPCGDYRLASHPECGVVERKKGLDELATNLLSGDRARFGNAFGRLLAGAAHPILLVEDNPARRWVPKGSLKVTENDVKSALWRLALENPKLMVVFTGRVLSSSSRLQIGADVVRMLLSATTIPVPLQEAA